ncbi:DUF4136 domain-containing protein [Mucilaginibacter mali]|uniref:DUF4136 domain-containing protein n=1 Tax=Mucilaginibacter mali TaxID=2740462 RepID=A0A7D4TVZ7_9SPHI|nr:DUF4136 domain-containing protein [Mucilaginibacter mali]QKJ30955.1 DUF4136 domain-containing protein [Mucilaginibacter mali]
MKRSITGCLLLAVVALVAACSSYNYYSVGSSSNVARYSTFAWLPPANNTKNPYFDNDLADQKVKDQATADLESKGLRLKANRPDLLVRYTIMVDNKVHTYNEPVYSYSYGGFYPRGYYRGGRAFYYGWRGAYPVYVGDDVYHVPYKEGTLILDIIDRNTHKVIWRGYGIGEVNNPERAVNDLPQIVDGILNKLQINKTGR